MNHSSRARARVHGPTRIQALLRLRESANIEQLQQLPDGTAFLEEMFLLLGRNLAVAATWLPTPARQEGIVAFLACRVLDAHEDLHADDKQSACAIMDACAFLCGNSATPPPVPHIHHSRESDQLEALLASRADTVRQAIQSLPPAAATRVRQLLTTIAQAMAEHRLQQAADNGASAQYGHAVLGRIVQYSLQLLGLKLPDSEDYLQLGHALQNLNHIRDLASDLEQAGAEQDGPARLLRLLLELVEASATASHLLGRLQFPAVSGERAALTYMVATSLASIYKQVRVPPTWLAANATFSARLARISPFFFAQLLQEIDNTLLQLILVLLHRETGNTAPAPALGEAARVLSSAQEKFELTIADQHPDAATAARLKRYVRLNRYSLAILHDLPDSRISGLPRNHVEGRKIMISDYFMAAAVGVMCEVGHQELALFSRVGAELIEDLESGLGVDAEGRTAAALSRLVLQAKGCSADTAITQIERNRQHSVMLFRQRQRSSWREWLLHALQRWSRKPEPLPAAPANTLFSSPTTLMDP